MIIEVGKKYWNRNRDTIVEIIYDRTHFGKEALMPLVGINNDGVIIYYNRDGKYSILDESPFDLVEEYKEMRKNSVEGWILFKSNSPPSNSEAIDVITDLDTTGFIYLNKAEMEITSQNLIRNEIIYGRFTFEELPEPKE